MYLMLIVLYGCPLGSPHYYNYLPVKHSVEILNNSLKFMGDISALHLPKNRVILCCRIRIKNKLDDGVMIKGISFELLSKVFEYQLLGANVVNRGSNKFEETIMFETKKKKLINNHIILSLQPKDSLDFELIFSKEGRIAENKFKNSIVNDTLNLIMKVGKNEYSYLFEYDLEND